MSWAIRKGETEFGFTFHYMDAELDTGGILAQVAIPFDDEHSWDELEPQMVEAITEMFPRVLERVEQGDPGDPQPEAEATYYSFFEPEYVWIDTSATREEIARQVRAWRFHSPVDGDRAARCSSATGRRSACSGSAVSRPTARRWSARTAHCGSWKRRPHEARDRDHDVRAGRAAGASGTCLRRSSRSTTWTPSSARAAGRC